MSDAINEVVIAKLRSRAEIGLKKYGVTMDRQDLTKLQWLIHAQEELLDGVVYLEKLIQVEAAHGIECGHNDAVDHSEFGLPLGYNRRCVTCGRMWHSNPDDLENKT